MHANIHRAKWFSSRCHILHPFLGLHSAFTSDVVCRIVWCYFFVKLAPKVLRGCIVYHPQYNYKVPFIHLTILQFASDEMGRVRLRFGQKKGSDYINASFVDVGSYQYPFQSLQNSYHANVYRGISSEEPT